MHGQQNIKEKKSNYAYVISRTAHCGSERDSCTVYAVEERNDGEKKRKVKGVRIIVKGRVVCVKMVM